MMEGEEMYLVSEITGGSLYTIGENNALTDPKLPKNN